MFLSRRSAEYLVSLICLCTLAVLPQLASAQTTSVARQPFEAATTRLVEALNMAGSPLSDAELDKLAELRKSDANTGVVRQIQELLDAHCLAIVTINPESRVKVARGKANAQLDQRGWTNFLVKVVNEAGATAALECSSPQAEPMQRYSNSSPSPDVQITPADAARRWMDIAMATGQPMTPTLSGLAVEYRILQLYARDAGPREATLSMHIGQGTQDLGFRSELPILFDCRPSVEIPLVIHDADGSPTTCSLRIRDKFGRVYPNPSRRVAPDFFFHQQIYRADGETMRLAPGEYNIEVYRGPEYKIQTLQVSVAADAPPKPLAIRLERWIHMASHGWFSGDHHVHAAGCSHYDNPAQGVTPADMMRHLIGEDLNVGCVLSWGPCWYFQKQYFDGAVSPESQPGNLMRYDVEVSGFPSSHAGHLCLLNLTEDDYPGAQSIDDWPTWTIPVLQWGKQQGGIVGYSHSGWGLGLPDVAADGSRVPANQGGQGVRAAHTLPDYAMPPFNGIGANEYIVAAALDACDFISAVDTPVIWELNIWYHTLNCGMRTRISGETDFPCIYGERVGLGRSYVQVPELSGAKELKYEDWITGLRDGRSYVGDGLSHLLQFSVGDTQLGTSNGESPISQVSLDAPGKQTVRCRIAAMLPEKQDASGAAIASRRLDHKPYWHLERARQAGSRQVPVELIVNGEAVATQLIEADGSVQDVSWDIELDHSSWVAVRILASMHSNPIFVSIDNYPIHTNKRSAQWCLDAVEVCWNSKSPGFRGSEQTAARSAYDQARKVYSEILKSFD